jgi:hypothetical protein
MHLTEVVSNIDFPLLAKVKSLKVSLVGLFFFGIGLGLLCCKLEGNLAKKSTGNFLVEGVRIAEADLSADLLGLVLRLNSAVRLSSME